ncbi:hypothetical protein NDU88_000433 [Pleurodeles waltl]|uniref:Uncharacterized protein n=1 Tax=Pleurodeles waltl TaxID=8319 RepID=A0AAV7V5G1_PLEWA|nr:hypothetical protein NDU88_000433 [Pleurodeles waltl]
MRSVVDLKTRAAEREAVSTATARLRGVELHPQYRELTQRLSNIDHKAAVPHQHAEGATCRPAKDSPKVLCVSKLARNRCVQPRCSEPPYAPELPLWDPPATRPLLAGHDANLWQGAESLQLAEGSLQSFQERQDAHGLGTDSFLI